MCRMRKEERKIILVGLLLLDQATKYLALKFGFGFINSGISFGLLFHDFIVYPVNFSREIYMGFIVSLLCVFLALLIILYLKKLHSNFLLLIITGGLSNLFDRLIRGGVVDFIGLPYLPSFNLADMVICLGCVLLIIDFLKTKPV